MAESKRSPIPSPDHEIDEFQSSVEFVNNGNKHHQDSLQEESKITAAATQGKLGENSVVNAGLGAGREDSKFLLENSVAGGHSMSLQEPSKVSTKNANSTAQKSPKPSGSKAAIYSPAYLNMSNEGINKSPQYDSSKMSPNNLGQLQINLNDEQVSA